MCHLLYDNASALSPFLTSSKKEERKKRKDSKKSETFPEFQNLSLQL